MQEPARVRPGGALSAKMSTLARRDTGPGWRSTSTAEIEAAGWQVLRFWEHEDPVRAADTVEALGAQLLG